MAIDDPAELQEEAQPDPAVQPRQPEVDGGEVGRDELFRVRGQQAADDPEAVRVQARRRLHQHHFGARAPLRLDDEQDGDFLIRESINRVTTETQRTDRCQGRG